MRNDSTIVEITAALLRERPRSVTLREIACAIDETESWLRKFSSGQIAAPSAVRVQKLYEHLSGKRLGD